ncbi:MAG: glycosyltransferase family 2 protein [Clostridiales bacterium]|nr:glycosyltransferase family 2 protein [Clostridiales bacterium]
MSKISVILPVYNAEKYLVKCLDSVINQTLKDIEIIILNDGSTDKSEAIIKNYQKKDKRIIYLFHENIGVGLTRDKGLNKATGEYVSFIDNDDYLELDMLEILYKKAKENDLDILCCEHIVEMPNKSSLRKKLPDIKAINITKDNVSTFFRDYYFTYVFHAPLWNKLYKREFVIKHNAHFVSIKLVFSDDHYFQIQLLANEPSIGFHPQPLYHHLVRQGSMMQSKKENFLKREIYLSQLIRELPYKNEKLANMIADGYLYSRLLNQANKKMKKNSSFKTIKQLLNELSQFSGYHIFLKSSRVNSSHKLFIKKKRRIFFYIFILLKNSKIPYLGTLLLYLKMKLLK